MLSMVKNQYKQVPAIVQFKLNEIKDYLVQKKSEGIQQIYDEAMLQRIDDFRKNPTLFQKTAAPKIPDGSPIGSDY